MTKKKFNPTSVWFNPETDELILIGRIKSKWLGDITLGWTERGNWLCLFDDQWFRIGAFS